MAFSGNFMCTSFKVELLKAVHNFSSGGSTFKIALYDNTQSFNAATTAYTTAGEVVGTGYTAGGNTLINVTPTTSGGGSTTAFTDFVDTVWSTATITAYGAIIYNTSSGNPAVAVLDFGGAKTSTAGDFTIIFPAATASTAIIRIA